MNIEGNFGSISGALVRTPRPYPTESLFGYVVRLTEANGYSSPAAIWKLARIPRGRELWAGFPARSLAPLVGLGPDVLDKLAYRVGERAYADGSNLQGRPFKILGHILGKGSASQARYLRLNTCAFCSQCVAEAGYIDAFWNLSVAIACPTHGRLALSQCPRCQRGLTWRRARLNRCSCGCDFSTVECPEAPTPVMLLMKLVQSALHGRALEGPSGMPTQLLSKLPLSALLSLIDRLGYLLTANPGQESAGSGASPKRKKQRKITVQGSLANHMEAHTAVSKALSDWPRGFHMALDAMSPGITGRTEENDTYRQDEDLFYSGLLKGKAVSRYLNFLRSEYVRHWGLKDANHVAQIRESLPSADDRGEMLSNTGDGSHADAPAGPILGDKDIPKAVGLPVSVLEVLRAQGIYRTSGGQGASYNWYKHDIEKFLDRLRALTEDGAICPRGYSRPTVTVTQAMSLKLRSAEAKADIISALLEGRLRAIATVHAPIGAVQIDRHQLNKFLLEKRVAVEGDTYSFPQCAQICGIDQCSVQDAVSQGFLQGVQRLQRLRISAQSVRAFKERYLPLSELARELRSTTTGLQNLCQRRGWDIVRLKRNGVAALQPLVQRDQIPEILKAIKEEAACREKRSFTYRRDASKTRLQAYLSALNSKGERLPRRGGKPDKSRITRACAFHRGVLYNNSELIKLLTAIIWNFPHLWPLYRGIFQLSRYVQPISGNVHGTTVAPHSSVCVRVR